MPYTAGILTFVFGALSAAAQSDPNQPDALSLLKNIEATYSSMNTYSAKVTSAVSISGLETQGKMDMETSTTVTADSSGKFRLETTGLMGRLAVYDGSTMWLYMPSTNSYYKHSLNDSSPAAQTGAQFGAGIGMGIFGGANPLSGYKNLIAALKEAKVLGSEKLHVNDSEVDCWVVFLDYEPVGSQEISALETAGLPAFGDLTRSRTLWVDKGRYLVYRDDSPIRMTMQNTNSPSDIKQTSKVESVRVNEPVSPDVFTFTPPSGAKEMDPSKFKTKTPEAPQTKN